MIAVAALAAAFLVASMSASGATAAGTAGPNAVAAKKKCKKKGAAAAKKCRRASAVARAKAFLAGSRLSRVSYSGTTGASSTLQFDFCRNGVLNFRGQYVGYSGYAWADSYTGTWSVSSATATSAQVPYTTSGYQVSDPAYASPPASSGTVTITALSATVALIDGTEFSRSAGPC